MCCKDSFAMNNGSTTPAAILPGKMEWCGIWNLNALERGDPIEPSSFHGTTVSHSLRSPLPFRRRYFCFVIFRPFSTQIENLPSNREYPSKQHPKRSIVRLLYPPGRTGIFESSTPLEEKFENHPTVERRT